MRVCHVIESAAAGSAGIMLTLAERGAMAGDEVTVIYSPLRASTEFMERAANAPIERLVPIKMRRPVCPHDLAAAMMLRRMLGPARFDVVHSHSSKAGALARLAGIGGDAAQVYSPHGFVTMSGVASPIYRPIERALSHLADAIVAVSEKERQHAVSLGIDAAKVHVVANGIPESLILTKPPRTNKGFTVGFVGRLCDQKNPLLALDAFALLHRMRPDSRLVMIGGGELEEVVARRVETLGLGASIELAGNSPALARYPTFDALLCSSSYEGMAVTFLEALANGVPIVSTDVGGVDELVLPGETGFIAANSADALANTLMTLASLGAAKRKLIGERCLAQARIFSAQAMFENSRAVYSRCLGR